MTEHAFIMTQSLTKDMNGKQDLFRPGAVRALCSITDPTTLQSIERYMKQAIVDKNTAVASAALISSFHLCDKAYDVVKRWVNEAQEACSKYVSIKSFKYEVQRVKTACTIVNGP